jgi:hypothetical protein
MNRAVELLVQLVVLLVLVWLAVVLIRAIA